MVHIGQKVKQVLYEQRIPIVEFASKINKSRTIVYSIFQRKTVDTALLHKISKVLDHDFFKYYVETLPMVQEEQAPYNKTSKDTTQLKEELQQIKKEFSELKEKYLMLQKINVLLEGKKKHSVKKRK